MNHKTLTTGPLLALLTVVVTLPTLFMLAAGAWRWAIGYPILAVTAAALGWLLRYVSGGE